MINQEQPPHALLIPEPVELLSAPLRHVEAPISDRSHHRGAKLTAIALSLASFGSVAANLRYDVVENYRHTEQVSQPSGETMHVDTFSDATPFPAAGASQEVELVKELQQPFIDVEGIYNNAKEVEVKFDGSFAPNYSVSPEVAKAYKDTITQDKGYVDGSQELMDKFNLNEEQAKGIKEQADLERILTVTNAKHIESVKSLTGLKFNFYEARQPDLGVPQYKMQIDPRAVEVITQTVLASLTSTEQAYLTPDQVKMVTELAQNGGLDSISISVVATGNLQACLLNMMPNGPDAKPYTNEFNTSCVGGYAQSRMYNEAPKSKNPAKNASNLLVMMNAPDDYKYADKNDVLNSVLVHEVAHQIAGIAGMTFKERTKGGNNTDPYFREHQMLTKPAQDTFANALEKISNKMFIKNLHAIEYMPINPSVMPVNETSKEVKKLRGHLDSISRALDEDKAFDVNILVGSVITNSPSAVGSPTAGGGALEGFSQNVVDYNPIVFDRPGTKRELYDPQRFVFTDVVHYEKGLRGAGGSQESLPKNGINNVMGYLLDGKATFMPEDNSSMSGDIVPVNVHIAAGQSMESGYLIGRDARGKYYQISFNFVKK